ncbi:MAG TPA: tyrosine/phenylalanine carboxypeptidase domain-containing protein [Labilithrix sp.]|nr:tyrosine/phenylalanine carboxypeptidase domain-containing protein [Labilithrix sp.]
MHVDDARELLERVTRALTALKSKGNLLDDIAWSRDVEEAFFASKCTKLPEPTYAIDHDALEDESARLEELARSIEGDEPIPVYLRAAVRSAVDRNRLLTTVGTKAFGDVSREIYGGARTRFLGAADDAREARNVDLADHLLARLKVHGWDEAKDKAPKKLGAEELAAELEANIEAHRPKIDIDVLLDDRCSSKAIAGMTRVRIRPDATFEPWEADGLYVHEVETHAFTAQNGAAQPLAPFLRAGGPRTTPTQEGLAVFAELHHRALATPRLERLATRVKLVEMSEDGASFLDLFRWLVDRGVAPRDAYLDATRICRGGLPEGGAPFTKDACYLAGLLHVYAFLSTFVRAGFRDEVEMLVAGRIAIDDVVALAELRNMGLLSRPRHRPSWLDRWTTLLPYFAFASFMDAIDLAPVEAHYRDLIKLAGAVRPQAPY